MKEKICKNCIYFHSEIYEKNFGGCGVNIDWPKKNENDTCIDMSTEDHIYTHKKEMISKWDIKVICERIYKKLPLYRLRQVKSMDLEGDTRRIEDKFEKNKLHMRGRA